MVLFLGCNLLLGQDIEESVQISFNLWEVISEKIQETACETYFPVFSFAEEKAGRQRDTTIWEELFGSAIPLYDYVETYAVVSHDDMVQEQSGGKERELQEDAMEIDGDIIEAVKRENENVNLVQEKQKKEEKMPSLTEFVKAEKRYSIDQSAFADFNSLVSEFYTVDSTTYIGRDQLNIKKLTEQDMTLQQKDASKPQILIYHTHSQEGFADSIPGEDDTTIIGAGDKLAQNLREYGFHVIHHTGKYDVESRDYAYSNAAPAVEQILEENPSIEVVIDLHRDQMPQETRLVTEVEGRPTARFMFFNGLSRTSKTGDIDYLQNPNLETNLAFSFQMQVAAQEYYPGLTRKIYLKGYRYNMQYRGKSLLIELGAQNNTVEEIMNACDPLAHILWLVLSGEA